VDNRLAKIATIRPGRIRQQDIPDLASALVGYWKGWGTVDANVSKNVAYVRLHGRGFDVLVTREDWVTILGLLQDGTLGMFPSPLTNNLTEIPAGKDFGDPALYNQTLATLSLAFADAEAYPVQTIQQGFLPSNIQDLVAQFDASRSTAVSLSSSKVSVWKDTIHGQNAFQANPTYRPGFEPLALNNLPGITFDGTQWLDLPLQAMQDWTVLIVGKYQESAIQTVGGFLVAAGYEGTGSGLDCYIKQNDNISPLPGPKGRLSTWVLGGLAAISPYDPALPPDTFKLLQWSQASRSPGGSRARIGLNQDVDLLGISATQPYDLSQEGWDPTRQLAGNPSPIIGAIGRYNGLLSGGPTFNLVGTICEILIYSRQLLGSEFSQLAVSLNTKWGGSLL
jgi:hypothetical protein